jgi:hypothetical protein
MTDDEQSQLLERVAGVLLIQMAQDGVSVTTRLLLDLHAWIAGGTPEGDPDPADAFIHVGPVEPVEPQS